MLVCNELTLPNPRLDVYSLPGRVLIKQGQEAGKLTSYAGHAFGMAFVVQP